MGSPAADSRLTSAGKAKTIRGSAATTCAKPPSPGNAATRSPAVTSAPSGAERTTPETSLPGMNGGGGLIWYSPRVSSTSGNVTPAYSTSMTTCPASGSGTSRTVTEPGPSKDVTCAARMAPEPSGGSIKGRNTRVSLTRMRVHVALISCREIDHMCVFSASCLCA